MDRDSALAVVRAAYAKQIMAVSRASDAAVEAAFAAVKREDFLGPGPWQTVDFMRGYRATPSDDPVYLYTNDLFGILPERELNNGQPSLHAYLLSQAPPRPGEHIVHVGTGVGYYTAIMAHMVGASGRVTGIEFDPQLAARSKSNFASSSNVQIIEGDGATVPFDAADVIYVNAGATRPAPAWLDRLRDGGRLILPLTTKLGFGKVDLAKMANRGAVFRIERRGEAYAARWISPVAIFPCAGNRDEAAEQVLARSFENTGVMEVTRLLRQPHVQDANCWVHGDGWCLASG